MLKYVNLFFTLFAIAVNVSAQSDSASRPTVSLNYGPAITFGPEVSLLKPHQYSANLDFRFWLRIVKSDKRHAFDHTLLLSGGYCFAEKQHLLRLRAGDLINLPTGVSSTNQYLRLGINAELLINKSNRIWLGNVHLGYKFRRLYYYVGTSYPFKSRVGSVALKPNIFVGFSFFLTELFTFVN